MPEKMGTFHWSQSAVSSGTNRVTWPMFFSCKLTRKAFSLGLARVICQMLFLAHLVVAHLSGGLH